eukprot:CAMPEP_0198152174 /NCGR_PEP_ID=MMETSP1443-20131203/58745_1 /TAXON_ID=186043 /ORGANISM="Entomoneis sp., Strain CCMP2396" /LENGTH=427 /DNA_ID=CAMNT_0043818103 /DNA_START=60 /DNA_END=1343 /DNA_ORIENTATION=-
MTCESYNKQRNPEQYCSNIALKANSKLGTMLDRACAWEWLDKCTDGSPDEEKKWLDEVPTMIVGLSTANGQGQEAKMVVVGTAYLDVGGQQCCYEARALTRSHIIHPEVIKGIFKNLMLQFIGCKNEPPKRLIVIRSGGHDGIFRDICQVEIGAMRKAYVELVQEKQSMRPDEWNCKGCKGAGCQLCSPKITCLVAQNSQNNIRLAPAKQEDAEGLVKGRQTYETVNVPSGTCVDSKKLLLPLDASFRVADIELRKRVTDNKELFMFTTPEVDNQDFFLVANGGLKGTSKGVHYRVIWNENYVMGDACLEGKVSQLTGEKLQRLLFALSFIYGKATKAPRDSALVRTASQLANTILSSMSSLGQDINIFFDRRVATGVDGGPETEIYILKNKGDSLIPSFGPLHSWIDDSGNEAQFPGDAFRPHVVA